MQDEVFSLFSSPYFRPRRQESEGNCGQILSFSKGKKLGSKLGRFLTSVAASSKLKFFLFFFLFLWSNIVAGLRDILGLIS